MDRERIEREAREVASMIVHEMLYNAREPMYPAEDRVTQRIAALVTREVERRQTAVDALLRRFREIEAAETGYQAEHRRQLLDEIEINMDAIRARSAQGGERG